LKDVDVERDLRLPQGEQLLEAGIEWSTPPPSSRRSLH